MTQQGVRWTAEQVLALAPDAASRKAGSKLGAAGPWSGAGSSDEGTVWGLCKGSGSKPYQTVVDMRTPPGPRTSAVARAGSSRASTRWGCCCSGRATTARCRRGAGAGLGASSGWQGAASAQRRGTSEAGAAASGGQVRRPGGGAAPGRAPGRADHRGRDGAGAAAGRPAARRPGRGRAGGVRAVGGDRGPHGRRPGARTGGAGTGVGGDPGARGPAGRCGCWRSARCSISSTRAGCAASGCRRRWRRRSVPGSACPAPPDGPPVRDRLAGPRPVRHVGRPAHHPPHLAARHASRAARRCSSPSGRRAALPSWHCRSGWRSTPRCHAVPGRRAAAGGPGRAVRARPRPTRRPTAGDRPGRGGGPLRRGAAGRPLAGLLPGDPAPRRTRARTATPGNWPTPTATRPAPHARRALPPRPVALVALSGGAPVTVFGECGHRGFTPLTAWSEAEVPGAGQAVPLC